MFSVVASGAVGVEDWIWLAEDGLTVKLDGLIVVLSTVCGVSSCLQLGCECVPLVGREVANGGLVDNWKLVRDIDLDSGWSLWLDLLENWLLLGGLVLLSSTLLLLLVCWRGSGGFILSDDGNILNAQSVTVVSRMCGN